MKKILIIFLLLYSSVSFAKGQHKLDTIPEEENDILSLEIEDNYYHIPSQTAQTDTNYINAILSYSFDFGFDAQVATYNCPLTGGQAQNFECDTYINLEKTFEFEQHKMIIGSQNGTTFTPKNQWHNLNFIVYSSKHNEYLETHNGSYYINKNLATIGYDSFGYTGGFILNIDKEWKIESDYFSGHTNVSGAEINVFFHDKFYFGVIVPETNSGNEFAGTVGIKLKTKK